MFSSSGLQTRSWVHTFPMTRVNCPGRSPSGRGATASSPSQLLSWCGCSPPLAPAEALAEALLAVALSLQSAL